MHMFIPLTSLRYLKEEGIEHFWCSSENPTTACLAGALLGSEVVRMRLLRGSHFDQARYSLVDEGKGTLPYHSWIVAKGDEQWPTRSGEVDAKTIMQLYLRGFACSATELRLSRPLVGNEHIYGFGERTGDMNKRGQAFPIWNINARGHHDDSVLNHVYLYPLLYRPPDRNGASLWYTDRSHWQGRCRHGQDRGTNCQHDG